MRPSLVIFFAIIAFFTVQSNSKEFRHARKSAHSRQKSRSLAMKTRNDNYLECSKWPGQQVKVEAGQTITYVSPNFPNYYGNNEHCGFMFYTSWFATLETYCDVLSENSYDPLKFYVDEGHNEYTYKTANKVLKYPDSYFYAEFSSNFIFTTKGWRCYVKAVLKPTDPPKPTTTEKPTEPPTTTTVVPETTPAPVEEIDNNVEETDNTGGDTETNEVESPPKAGEGQEVVLPPVDESEQTNNENLPVQLEISECRGDQDIELENGKSIVLTSPNYPETYNHETKCGWKVTTGEDHIVSITCSEFSLGDGDWLRVNWRNVKMFRGPSSKGPQELTFNKRRLWAKFFSNEAVNGAGFKCVVKSAPQQRK